MQKNHTDTTTTPITQADLNKTEDKLQELADELKKKFTFILGAA
jgi:hypothetical protein